MLVRARKLVAVALAGATVGAALLVPPAAAGGTRNRVSADRMRELRTPSHPTHGTTGARDALDRALARGRLTGAEYALERARSVFRYPAVRARFGHVRRPEPRAATPLLLDLALRLDRLSSDDREAAERLLARPSDFSEDPTDGYEEGTEVEELCTDDFCIHWVETTDDAPELTDTTPSNGVPDWVDETRTTLENVWATEIDQLGYRPPKSDLTSENNEGDGRLDVYIADIGDDFTFGFCTTDDPNAEAIFTGAYQFSDLSAWCAVDDDMDPEQFPGTNGVPALQVTLAHEFFHAVQFGYDATEDLWLLEGTATWMEDVVYDDIDDNYQYLPASQLSQPEFWLDFSLVNTGNPFADGAPYGTWVFFRFLTEFDDTVDTLDTDLIREIFERVDGAEGGTDRYSLQAVAEVTNSTLGPFRDVFHQFARWNLTPDLFYEEGEAYVENAFPLPTAVVRVTKARRNRSLAIRGGLDHLTHRYVVLVPRKGVKPRARLRVKVDGPPRRTAPEATIATINRAGLLRFRSYNLGPTGDGTVTIAFGKRQINLAVLILTNASTRLVCGRRQPFSCEGAPRDEGARFGFTYTLKQKR